MARVEVSKEYVREQLHAMGVRDLSEQDLEAYTRGQGFSWYMFIQYKRQLTHRL